MSREILFRGKSKSFSSWEYGCLIQSRGEYFIGNTVGNDPENWCYVYPETVGQFTGLLDKNGNKIFEGDILKCISPNDGHEFVSDFIATLANGINFKNKELRRDMIIYEYDWMEVEVIGNIHDDPELIGKERHHG